MECSCALAAAYCGPLLGSLILPMLRPGQDIMLASAVRGQKLVVNSLCPGHEKIFARGVCLRSMVKVNVPAAGLGMLRVRQEAGSHPERRHRRKGQVQSCPGPLQRGHHRLPEAGEFLWL